MALSVSLIECGALDPKRCAAAYARFFAAAMSQAPVRYKIQNWAEYNQALIRRGDITWWFDQDVIARWQQGPRTGRRGRPVIYSDVALQCMLALRLLYRLPLRAAQGLLGSLLGLLGCVLPVPNYSTLCRRQRHLSLDLGVNPSEGPRHVLVDSTGLKVFGEGEWKVRQHGVDKRRTWRKLHLAVDTLAHLLAAHVPPANEQERAQSHFPFGGSHKFRTVED